MFNKFRKSFNSKNKNKEKNNQSVSTSPMIDLNNKECREPISVIDEGSDNGILPIPPVRTVSLEQSVRSKISAPTNVLSDTLTVDNILPTDGVFKSIFSNNEQYENHIKIPDNYDFVELKYYHNLYQHKKCMVVKKELKEIYIKHEGEIYEGMFNSYLKKYELSKESLTRFLNQD